MIARVAGWWALFALLALACLWNMADRLARRGVLLSLPAPLLTGGDALTARSWQALLRRDAATADRLARAALRRRPVDAATLRVAGLSAIAAGQPARGDALMRLAGTAGWRDVPTQLYWAEVALDGGEMDVAAERLDAVARVQPLHPRARALLGRLEASAAGRAALLRRWREPTGWTAIHLEQIDDLSPAALGVRVATIEAARRAGVPLDAAALDRLGWGLLDRGRADLAYRLAVRAPGHWVADFAADASSRPGPFAWTLSAAPGLDALVELRGGRAALHARASGPSLLPIATHLLRLPPGPARLTLAVTGARTPTPVIATLDCLRGAGAIAAPEAAQPGRLSARLSVAGQCPTQRLTLFITGEEARRAADLWLSAPTVTPLGGDAP